KNVFSPMKSTPYEEFYITAQTEDGAVAKDMYNCSFRFLE
ncbi:hypothetical protein RUMOBE_04161, partial [Blautia obeum ATCC 29174]